MALLAPVFSVLAPLVNSIVPALLLATLMPVQDVLQLRLPWNDTVPAVRPVTSAIRPAVVFVIAGTIVMLAVPPSISTALPVGSSVAPIVPPLISTTPVLLLS